MSNAKAHHSSVSTHWQAIISLGILYAVFVFSILAYEQNQNLILQRHGLEHFSHSLEIWALVISCLIPPLAGWLSDRNTALEGKRFLVISTAVVVTALLFMTVAMTYSAEPGSSFAQILPYLMLLWVAGMNFFHSPTHSFIREFAPKREWPLANAVILLIAGLITAGQIFISKLLTALGVPATFITGGLLLSLSAWWFVRNVKQVVHTPKPAPFSAGNWWWPLLYGAMTGMAVAIFAFMLHQLSYGDFQLGNDNEYLEPMVLAVLALVAIPVGLYAQKIGTDRLFERALPAFALLVALGLGAKSYVSGWLLLPFIMLVFSAFKITGLPKALQYAENGNAGFTVGVFWAGFNAIALAAFFYF